MSAGMNPSGAASQFETWNHEENSFQTAAARADRERSRVEDHLRSLRHEQAQLSNETRESSDTLGHFHRERGLLQKENERFLQLLHEDRMKLEELAIESDELVAREMTEKTQFCIDMEAMSDELAAVLMQQENQRLKKLLLPTTVAHLCESLGASTPDELTIALGDWKGAYDSFEKADKDYTAMTKQIETSRAKVMQQEKSVGEASTTCA